MSFAFRPAKRSEAKPLIGLYAQSGAGKTLSALLLARGFAGPDGQVGMIETESGRGEAYADDPRIPGGYVVLPLRDDPDDKPNLAFSPKAFEGGLRAAEKAGLDALIIDSASHEWDAPGGVRFMAEENEAAGKRGMMVWQKPKMDHQRHFMLPLLSTPIPLVILCMRARYPMEEILVNGKKVPQRSTKLEPYQSDTILFEMFCHGWIDQEHKFHGGKWTREELRQVLRDNEPITLETGQRLAAWAKGDPTDQRAASRVSGLAASPGATSGGGTGGDLLATIPPEPWEGVVTDYEAGFEEAPSPEHAEGLRTQWKKVKDTVPAVGQRRVEAAIQRARMRLSRGAA